MNNVIIARYWVARIKSSVMIALFSVIITLNNVMMRGVRMRRWASACSMWSMEPISWSCDEKVSTCLTSMATLSWMALW